MNKNVNVKMSEVESNKKESNKVLKAVFGMFALFFALYLANKAGYCQEIQTVNTYGQITGVEHNEKINRNFVTIKNGYFGTFKLEAENNIDFSDLISEMVVLQGYFNKSGKFVAVEWHEKNDSVKIKYFFNTTKHVYCRLSDGTKVLWGKVPTTWTAQVIKENVMMYNIGLNHLNYNVTYRDSMDFIDYSYLDKNGNEVFTRSLIDCGNESDRIYCYMEVAKV
ncbi:MAG: hypothetical protein ACM3O3_13010 [Syntrophothermus sp.]